MTDPVREEMIHIQNRFLLGFGDWHQMGLKNMDMKIRDEWWRVGQERRIKFTDDLLRVIRGHTRPIEVKEYVSPIGTVGMKSSYEKPVEKIICDFALTKTLESLPEEVKDD